LAWFLEWEGMQHPSAELGTGTVLIASSLVLRDPNSTYKPSRCTQCSCCHF